VSHRLFETLAGNLDWKEECIGIDGMKHAGNSRVAGVLEYTRELFIVDPEQLSARKSNYL